MIDYRMLIRINGSDMSQLIDRLFPTTEISSSNPVIGHFYLLSTEKEKEAVNDQI